MSHRAPQSDPPRPGAVDRRYAERAILGALLCDPERALPVVRDLGLLPEHFAHDRGALLAAALALDERGTPVDLVCLTAELQAAGRLADVGGIVGLARLAEELPNPGAVAFYSHRVLEAAANEAVTKVAGELRHDPGKLSALAAAVEAAQRARTGGPKVHKVSARELVTTTLPARDWLIDGMLRRQDTAMMHGPRGLGKSWLVLTIAVALAAGVSFLRWSVPKPVRVLLLDGELPAVTLQERLRVVAQALGVEVPDGLDLIAADCQSEPLPNLSTPGGQAWLDPHLEGADVLILDNLSTLAPLAEDNAVESWHPVQSWLLSLRRRGLTSLLVHHSGKTGQQRGSSAKEDILDLVLALRSLADWQPGESARFRVSVEKARGLHGADVSPFEASLSTDPDGRPCWLLGSTGVEAVREMAERDRERQERNQTILDLHGQGLSQREIAARTGVAQSTVNRIILHQQDEEERPLN